MQEHSPAPRGRTIEARYVRLADVGRFLAEGWTLRDDMANIHHGAYAVLMIRDAIEDRRDAQ